VTLIFIITVPQLLTGCSRNSAQAYAVESSVLYSEIIGFSDNDETSKSIPKDAILMITNDKYQEFYDKYFKIRKFPIKEPDKNKAVLYLQIPSNTSSVKTYSVKSINVKDNTLTVNLNEGPAGQVHRASGYENSIFKFVMLIQLDKTQLKDNMKITVNK
jgi:hypothetical protein